MTPFTLESKAPTWPRLGKGKKGKKKNPSSGFHQVPIQKTKKPTKLRKAVAATALPEKMWKTIIHTWHCL